jgi:capsular exopolysaccharide synthesis family protein
MSRIHEVLNKAERDGTARRIRAGAGTFEALDAPSANAPAPEPVPAATTALREVPLPTALSGAGAAPFGIEPASIREITGIRLDPLLIAATAPHSFAAEEFRTLRTRIAQSDTSRTVRAIAITSAAKGDGKSVSAANLALTMAQEFQRRVVLVDGDLRHPRLHHLLGLSDGVGLADVLSGTTELDAALLSLPEHNLTVLPAGLPPSQPAELLSSTAMRRVIETLRQRFDRIVIDLPPATPLADVQILSPLVDGVVFIVRAGVTPKPAIERALAAFDRAKVLGMVLNEATPESEATYRAYAPQGA